MFKLVMLCWTLLFTFQEIVFGETYWVSPTGKAQWSLCRGEIPLNHEEACSLEMANKNAVAGDTIYLRGGIYLQTSQSGCGNDYVCGIYPKNSGRSDARITFSAYGNEVPVITTEPNNKMSSGITLKGSKYIRVTGITFKNLYRWVLIYNYASHNEIDHCTFYSETGEDFGGAAGINISSMCAGGSSWVCYSKHNWIHHNVIMRAHQYGEKPCVEGADLVRIGSGYSSAFDNQSDTEQCDYNTVENNLIAYGGHALMDTYGGKNVVKNNIFHNEGWIPDFSGGKCTYPPMPNGKYGHRCLQTSEDFGRRMQYVLVEGNRFGFSSANPNNPGEANYAITSPGTIVRYNYSFGAHQSGIGTKWYRAFPNGIITQLREDIDDTTTSIPVASTKGVDFHFYYLKIEDERIYCKDKDETSFFNCTRGYLGTSKMPHKKGLTVPVNSYANRGQGGTGPYKIRIYNNTSFWNGHTYPYMQSPQPGCATCPGKLAGINVYSLAWDVIIKNNIAYDNYSYILYGYDITVDTNKDPNSYPGVVEVLNNWTTSNGDPRFTNPDISDPTSTTLPDLTLQLDSGAIDKGVHLTVAIGDGMNSVDLYVEDAMYFQDGSWGSDLARGKTMFPDWIAIGSIDNVVEIESIDYYANKITLKSPMKWKDGDKIWLYKKSDGEIVLYGNSPDLGAHEVIFNAPTDVGLIDVSESKDAEPHETEDIIISGDSESNGLDVAEDNITTDTEEKDITIYDTEDIIYSEDRKTSEAAVMDTSESDYLEADRDYLSLDSGNIITDIIETVEHVNQNDSTGCSCSTIY